MKQSELRVAILGLNYAPEPTGIAPYTTRLAERLVAEGHQVSVITGFPHYPEWKIKPGYTGWTKHELLNGVKLKRLRHYVPTKPNTLRRIHLELSFGIRLLLTSWGRPEVVIVVTPALFSSACALIRARFGARRPVTGIWVQDIYSRGLVEMHQANSLTAKGMQTVEKMVLRSATQVAVIHERFKSYLISSMAIPENRIQVIRNWTHIKPSGTMDPQSTRRRFGWREHEIVVLHAGNIGAKQALENVVESARLADRLESNVRFVLLGDGNQRTRIQALAEGTERIQFIDPLPDDEFINALNAADILLVNEQSGLRDVAVPSKLTTYFATGKPVVAATEIDSTTAEEMERAGGGVRVDPDTPIALLEAVQLLGNDVARSKELGSAGVRYVANALSEDAAILQYSAWLQELRALKRSATS